MSGRLPAELAHARRRPFVGRDKELLELDQIPFDWIRTIALGQLIEVAALLGVDDHLEALGAALAPYSGELIVVATGTQCTGAVDRYLALAAAGLGDVARARTLLEAALALEVSVDAPPLVARTRSWMNTLP